MNEGAETAVEVVEISKNYGPVMAVRSVSLSVPGGQYFALLGPSGGGKTTLLRLIGGFARPSAGRVLLHGRDVTDLPPNERPTSMVFQGYALFPHMNVANNVAYGLKLRKLSKALIAEKVGRMLELVGLSGLDARMPHELSGGQQQRVQLARSLVLDADILLLDEPLASLDAKLRKDMCIELKRIQEQVGITFVHVTHNQEEAMTIADHIAIIAAGELVEEGTARDVYERPVRRFTAEFIGENNIFDGRVVDISDGGISLDLGHGVIAGPANELDLQPGAAISLSVRSERMVLLAPEDSRADELQTLTASYRNSVYLGLTVSHLVVLPNGREIVLRELSQGASSGDFRPGSEVVVAWDAGDARLHTN